MTASEIEKESLHPSGLSGGFNDLFDDAQPRRIPQSGSYGTIKEKEDSFVEKTYISWLKSKNPASLLKVGLRHTIVGKPASSIAKAAARPARPRLFSRLAVQSRYHWSPPVDELRRSAEEQLEDQLSNLDPPLSKILMDPHTKLI